MKEEFGLAAANGEKSSNARWKLCECGRDRDCDRLCFRSKKAMGQISPDVLSRTVACCLLFVASSSNEAAEVVVLGAGELSADVISPGRVVLFASRSQY